MNGGEPLLVIKVCNSMVAKNRAQTMDDAKFKAKRYLRRQQSR